MESLPQQYVTDNPFQNLGYAYSKAANAKEMWVNAKIAILKLIKCLLTEFKAKKDNWDSKFENALKKFKELEKEMEEAQKVLEDLESKDIDESDDNLVLAELEVTYLFQELEDFRDKFNKAENAKVEFYMVYGNLETDYITGKLSKTMLKIDKEKVTNVKIAKDEYEKELTNLEINFASSS